LGERELRSAITGARLVDDLEQAGDPGHVSLPSSPSLPLLFLDEFGCNRGMVPRHGRARSGRRVHINKPKNRGANLTIAGVMGLGGLLAVGALEGSANVERFLWFVTTVLVPLLRPGHVVVMDNLRAHHNVAVVAAIEATGARTLFLPAYSPEFNPIEECWSKLKNLLRKAQARTDDAVYAALDEALNLVSDADIVGWVRHAGYAV